MKTLFSLLVLVVLLPVNSPAGDRCADRIVSIGDSGTDLLIRCGEPDWKQSHAEEIIEADDRDARRKVIITVEQWTYDSGPDRFMRIFTLRNGRISDIRTGDYGAPRGQENRSVCSDRVISRGDSAAEVLAKCGEPFNKDRREEEIVERTTGNTIHRKTVIVEDWTYNSGPNRFLRIFTFRNGEVTDIRTGGYGY